MTNKNVKYLPSLGRLLNFAARGVSALSENRLAPHGLTLAQWVVLTALWRQDRIRISDLARYTRSDNAVLSRTLDRMTRHGLVEREADGKDRRVVRVKLTEKAKALSHLVGFYEDINRDLLEGFSETERRTLFSLLDRVIVNAEAALAAADAATENNKTKEISHE